MRILFDIFNFDHVLENLIGRRKSSLSILFGDITKRILKLLTS